MLESKQALECWTKESGKFRSLLNHEVFVLSTVANIGTRAKRGAEGVGMTGPWARCVGGKDSVATIE